ncbi:MAG: hypothetical protein ACRETM_09700 [Stenotrophobium sp.]
MIARIAQTQIAKFAAVYAEAVLTWLDAREPQALLWDGVSHHFDFRSLDLDAPGVPVITVIEEHWERLIGDVDEIIDPESEHFDADALRKEIEYRISEEGYGERILKTFLKRLEQMAQLAAEDDDAGTHPENPDLDTE